VARPDDPGARLAAKPFPEEVAMRLKGQGGIYA
jgi:hypothetical protein